MNAVLAAARRAGPTLAALLVSYAGASSGLLAEKSPVSQDSGDAPTTPMCQKDYLESNRADVFKHTGPDTVKTGSKVHGRMQIFTGNGNPDLADEIVAYMNRDLDKAEVKKFKDGEISVRISKNVRGNDAFVVQSTGPPVSEHLMELLLLVSTLRRSHVDRIVVVIPYFGYKRDTGMPLSSSVSTHAANYLTQGSDMPLSAASVAQMIEAVGADHVLTLDLSPPGFSQVEGFFKVSCDDVRSTGMAVRYLARTNLQRPVIMASNESCIPLAQDVADGLRNALHGTEVEVAAVFESRPVKPQPLPQAQVQQAQASAEDEEEEDEDPNSVTPPSTPPAHFAGSSAGTRLEVLGDVAGREVVLVDDIIDTARSIEARIAAVLQAGASRVLVFAAHGLFSRGALKRIERSGAEQVIVTNSLPPVPYETEKCSKIVRLSVAPVLAEAMVRVHNNESLYPLKVFSAHNVRPRYRGQDDDDDGKTHTEDTSTGR